MQLELLGGAHSPIAFRDNVKNIEECQSIHIRLKCMIRLKLTIAEIKSTVLPTDGQLLLVSQLPKISAYQPLCLVHGVSVRSRSTR